MKKNLDRSGFTLIELLVVIAIIAILTGIVLGFMTSSRNKARYSSLAQELRQAENAFQLFRTDKRCWPRESGTSCAGVALGSNPPFSSLINHSTLGFGQYLAEPIKWPFSSQAWKYDNDGDSEQSNCAAGSPYEGVNLLVSGATADQYRELNTLFDKDANPDTNAARRCGKIQFSGTTGTGDLFYNISRVQ